MEGRFERFSYMISEISRYWHKLAADEMEKYGLKSAHAIYLNALSSFDKGITSARLCEICGKDKSDVSRMITILEGKGLLKRENERQNQYRARLILTEQGKRAADQVKKRAQLAVEIAGASLSDETRETFYMALETIANNLKQISKDGLP